MASPFDGIDMTDPCAVYPVLEQALNMRLAGIATAEIEQRTQISTVRQEFFQADIATLRSQIDQLRNACRKKQGQRPGVFAIRAGMR